MQALCFFLSVFFGITGGYFILRIFSSSVTKKLAEGYSKRTKRKRME